jgi:hypothetical protein
MAEQPQRVRIADLPDQFEERFAGELARGGVAAGRAAVVAFLDAAGTELADWSPATEDAGILQCEIDSNEEKVFLGLIRTMSHYYETDGDWRSDTHFNLQTAFERAAECVDAYAAIYVGEEPGTETPENFLQWLSDHPTVGPVLDSIPLEMEAYLDGDTTSGTSGSHG